MTGRRAKTQPTKRPPRERSRWRWVVYLAVVAVYVALMWYLVFPWVDRTFVNQPAL